MTHVLVTAVFPPHLLDKLRAVSPQITVEQFEVPKDGWPDDKITPADVYYAATRHVPDLQHAPNLRWVQGHWAGINHLVGQPVWASDVIITTASGIHAVNMAQYLLTQMLAWAHRVPQWVRTQAAGTWPAQRWEKFVPQELRGATVGILGYGSIGRELARLLKPFGVKILVTKRDVLNPKDSGFAVPGTGDPSGDLPDRIYPMQATRSMVALCDYVVITLPLTSETRYLFDESLLKEMKSSAYLINVGRGSIIDEAALVKGLEKEWIAGAGLDVFEEEPLPDSSPLWQMENVILTPHVSGFTPHYDDRATDLFAENLRRYVAGETLLNVVDREIGY